MKLHFTSSYHPEGDGQTKQTNQILEQYLQIFCNYQQDNWYTLLPLAEFAYNNTPSSTTGISLFLANKGYHLNLTIHPERDLEQKTTIAEAQLCYQGPEDAHCAPPLEFSVGKQAFVKAKFFHTNQPSHKLSDKYLGPLSESWWNWGIRHGHDTRSGEKQASCD